jgi:2-haloacid dehalogenase
MGFAHYVFDAYGTLFDVHSAAARHRDAIGRDWERLSSLWRTKQLEYTWVHAGIGRHATFAALTEQGLDFAIASVGGVPPGTRARLLDAYRTLDAYPEVKHVLARLQAKGARLAILSNGDPDMLDAAIVSAGLGGVFDAVLSVADAGIFKPAKRVYELATREFAVDPPAISFQSSNRWDIAGGGAFGFRTVWVNRAGAPNEYPELPADVVVEDLTALLAED